MSPIDPQAKLYRKADKQPAKLYYMGHVLMDRREGLAVDVEVTEANGFAEREAALAPAVAPRAQEHRSAQLANKGRGFDS